MNPLFYLTIHYSCAGYLGYDGRTYPQVATWLDYPTPGSFPAPDYINLQACIGRTTNYVCPVPMWQVAPR